MVCSYFLGWWAAANLTSNQSIHCCAQQDKFYTECMLIIKGSEAIKYEEYLLIAQGKVASFLARDDVSTWVLLG